jgi:hypothetical protein
VISSPFASLLHINGGFVGAGLTQLSVGMRDVSLNPPLHKNDSTEPDLTEWALTRGVPTSSAARQK